MAGLLFDFRSSLPPLPRDLEPRAGERRRVRRVGGRRRHRRRDAAVRAVGRHAGHPAALRRGRRPEGLRLDVTGPCEEIELITKEYFIKLPDKGKAALIYTNFVHLSSLARARRGKPARARARRHSPPPRRSPGRSRRRSGPAAAAPP